MWWAKYDALSKSFPEFSTPEIDLKLLWKKVSLAPYNYISLWYLLFNLWIFLFLIKDDRENYGNYNEGFGGSYDRYRSGYGNNNNNRYGGYRTGYY